MKIYLIMPVRMADPAVTKLAHAHMEALESRGDEVHYPPRDAPQDDPTGRVICETHRAAMLEADEVHIFWDVNSKGSHFDLGMAYALGKKIVPWGITEPDPPGKSYWKAVITPVTVPVAPEAK